MDSAQYKVRVGARLRVALEATGKSQSEIARLFGIDRTKLSHWVRGRHYPDPLFLKQFCDRFNLSTDFIYRGQVAGVAASLADTLWRADQASQAAVTEPQPPDNDT